MNRSLQLPPKLLLATLIVAIGMIPVGLVLAWLGVVVLELSGGAADDTSVVVAIAGYLVADFWGAGIVTALTRARSQQVAAAWTGVRAVILVAIALVTRELSLILPLQMLLTLPAAWAGARVSRKQAALRRAILEEQQAQ